MLFIAVLLAIALHLRFDPILILNSALRIDVVVAVVLNLPLTLTVSLQVHPLFMNHIQGLGRDHVLHQLQIKNKLLCLWNVLFMHHSAYKQHVIDEYLYPIDYMIWSILVKIMQFHVHIMETYFPYEPMTKMEKSRKRQWPANFKVKVFILYFFQWKGSLLRVKLHRWNSITPFGKVIPVKLYRCSQLSWVLHTFYDYVVCTVICTILGVFILVQLL